MHNRKYQFSARSLVLCALFAALTAVGAFLKIPVPVLPFTLQTMFTTLAGLILGSKLGAASVGVYIALGLMGLPVFTKGGGIGYVLQPSFGYIIGFMVGAFVTGWIIEKSGRLTFKRLFVAGLAGLAVIYFIGMIYFYLIQNLYFNASFGIGSLFLYCFAMTIPGDILTCMLGALLAKRLIPILKKG